MPKPESKAHRLIREGRLFELQQALSERLPVRSDEDRYHHSSCCLYAAVDAGFHSVVEVLVDTTEWNKEELDSALERAMETKRLDLVDMLLAKGASVAAISFYDVCSTVDYGLMKRMLELGVNPAADSNGFARALNEIKARPLLRFYKDHSDEHPALCSQIALALCAAIEEKNERWAAMLRWAGADPFMAVPYDIWGSWDFETELSETAAERACSSGNPAMVKLLKLKPDASQASDLIQRVSWHPSSESLEILIKSLPKGLLRSVELDADKAIEAFMTRRSFAWGNNRKFSQDDEDAEAAKCLEILLDAGLTWSPLEARIRDVRRRLIENSSRYVVRIIRLLVYISGAATPEVVEELCRTPAIRRKIYSGDKKLGEELKAWFTKPRL